MSQVVGKFEEWERECNENNSSGSQIQDILIIEEEIMRCNHMIWGTYTVTYKATHHTTGLKLALKNIHTTKKIQARHTNILKEMGNHPNILKIHEITQSKQCCRLVTEFMDGGNLSGQIIAISGTSEVVVSSIVRQIVAAVAHLHANDIIHGNLKPQNVLLAGPGVDDIRVGDYCLSTYLMVNYYFPIENVYEYEAPEYLTDYVIDKPNDLWSIGVITYYLLIGHSAFWHVYKSFQNEKIRKVDYSWPDGVKISCSAKDFVENLLQKDPLRRLTAEQALNHPWVMGQTSNKIK